jgi:hypothetical protein
MAKGIAPRRSIAKTRDAKRAPARNRRASTAVLPPCKKAQSLAGLKALLGRAEAHAEAARASNDEAAAQRARSFALVLRVALRRHPEALVPTLRHELDGLCSAILGPHGIVRVGHRILPVFEQGRAPTPSQRSEAERIGRRAMNGRARRKALAALGVRAFSATGFADRDGAPVDVHSHPDPLVGIAAFIAEGLDRTTGDITNLPLDRAREAVEGFADSRVMFTALSLAPLAQRGEAHLRAYEKRGRTNRERGEKKFAVLRTKALDERARLVQDHPHYKASRLDKLASEVAKVSARSVRRWRLAYPRS